MIEFYSLAFKRSMVREVSEFFWNTTRCLRTNEFRGQFCSTLNWDFVGRDD